MPDALTELERRVLEYLVHYLRSNTYQPSIREIGREFSIKSTKTVSELLQSLADKGWIERDPSRSRGVRLLGVHLQPDVVTVPLYASPDQSPLGGLALDRQFAGHAGTYLVGVPDGSLGGMGINTGDLLLVEPVSVPELQSGDVIFGTLHGGPLVRRLSEAQQLECVPAGSQPAVALSAVKVAGRGIGVLRRLRAATSPTPAAVVHA